jgi:succinate-acetate transporter protein
VPSSRRVLRWPPACPHGGGAATFTVSTVLAGWFGPQGLVATIPMLIIFGGITQFLAGMWSYARANVLATVAFGSFGSFNVAFGILLWLDHTGFLGVPLLRGDTNVSLVAGVFVLMFALISAFLAYAAIADSLLIAAVLAFLLLAYLADGVGLWIGGHNFITAIGGYSGIVSSLLAFYAAAAIVVNAVRGREALPVFAVRR